MAARQGWTPDEDAEIKDMNKSVKELRKLLPHRTESAIRNRRHSLQYPDRLKNRPRPDKDDKKKYYSAGPASRPWTHEEDQAISDPRAPSDKILAEQLDRSPSAIENRRWRLKRGVKKAH